MDERHDSHERAWEERLDELLAGSFDAAPADAPDLTAAVLARTSGPACGRAADLLAALPDGAPALGDAQLLHAHLAHCPACRALGDTLAWLTPELRAMAEVAPDPEFVADVLATTARLREAAAARARRRSAVERALRPLENWAERSAARVGAWWRRQLERPRFALEFAYVGTMILLALCATPVSPLRDAPGKALAVVKASPSGIATVTTWVWDALPDEITDVGRAAWNSTGGRATRAVDASTVRLSARQIRTAPLRGELRRHLSDTGRALVQFDFVAAAQHWDATRSVLKNLWRAWRADEPAADPRARA